MNETYSIYDEFIRNEDNAGVVNFGMYSLEGEVFE